MSTKKKSKFKLEELFSASSFGVCLYIKSDLHKILDNFYLNGFHIEETTSYNNMIDTKAASIFYVDSLGGRGGQKNAYFTK